MPVGQPARRDVSARLLDALQERLRAAEREGGRIDVQAALGDLQRLEPLVGLLRKTAVHSFNEFEKRVEELSFLRSMSELFASVFERRRLCRSLLRVVERLLRPGHCFLHLHDAEDGWLELAADHGTEHSPADQELALRVATLAALGTRPLPIADVACDDETLRFAEGASLRSFLACPIVSQGERLGVISVAELTPSETSEDTVRVLHTLCDLAAVALRHSRLCEEHLRHQRHLEALVEKRTREVGEIRLTLSRQERIAATGRLAASIAHEINNPMSFLVSNLERAREYARILSDTVPSLLELASIARELDDSGRAIDPTLHEAAQRIPDPVTSSLVLDLLEDFQEVIAESYEGIQRIRNVGDDLRSFAHGTSGAPEPLDFNQLVETALHVVRAEVKDRASFECRLGVLPKLRGLRYQLIQVLVNLLKNAAESSDQPVTVRVETRAVGSFVELEVADDGPGVPASATERIFEPFYTTKETGSGLGLSVSRGIAAAHGGTLEAHSNMEGGLFLLRIPTSGPGRAQELGDPTGLPTLAEGPS